MINDINRPVCDDSKCIMINDINRPVCDNCIIMLKLVLFLYWIESLCKSSVECVGKSKQDID